MLFNSIEFLVFFVLVFSLYWFVLQKHFKLQNILLLVSSYVFYGWWDWRFLSLIFISSLSDYWIGLIMDQSDDGRRRKRLLYVSLILNLSFLGFFKYYNFFVDSLVSAFEMVDIHLNVRTLNVILPVGISFYTFQTMSYTIDVYNRKMSATKDILSFFTFVAFFPQLVAGPIERAKHLLPQFTKPRVFDYDIARSGAQLALLGFFKKVVIADSVAVLVNTVYNDPQSYHGFPMVIATLFFAFQIYCDFSGYSDIAIGLSRMLGFDLMINFKTPYFSKSLTEFWRRWHISLSSWFRDYVYIPLGGSRNGRFRTMYNLFITFVISGLWHGANWTFILWGAFHGFFLVIEKFFNKERCESKSILRQSLRMFLTFSFVCFAWIFFRSNSVSDAFYIIQHMFSDISDWTDFLKVSLKFRGMGLTLSEMVTVIGLILFLIALEVGILSPRVNRFMQKHRSLRWSVYFFLLFAIILYSTKNNASNFIYFQF